MTKRKTRVKHCQHNVGDRRCLAEGASRYYFPGGEYDGQYCPEHASLHGFCWSCRQFWAGVDSFDFQHPALGLCEHCAADILDEETAYDDEYGFGDIYGWVDTSQDATCVGCEGRPHA